MIASLCPVVQCLRHSLLFSDMPGHQVKHYITGLLLHCSNQQQSPCPTTPVQPLRPSVLQVKPMTVFLCAGSPIISPEAWLKLLEACGFSQALRVGSALSAPPLLCQQSVMVGISDGAVHVRNPALGPVKRASKAAATEAVAGAVSVSLQLFP